MRYIVLAVSALLAACAGGQGAAPPAVIQSGNFVGGTFQIYFARGGVGIGNSIVPPVSGHFDLPAGDAPAQVSATVTESPPPGLTPLSPHTYSIAYVTVNSTASIALSGSPFTVINGVEMPPMPLTEPYYIAQYAAPLWLNVAGPGAITSYVTQTIAIGQSATQVRLQGGVPNYFVVYKDDR